MELFVGVIPMAIMIIINIGAWLGKEKEFSDTKDELEKRKNLQYLYQDLLTSVRIRQHNFNNQITAILGTHYVYKTYEELVKSQQKFCEEIKNNNKYYALLKLEDSVLAGFLYKKFLELEYEKIEIEYGVKSGKFHPNIPVQYLIEMLGILLDNAADEVKIRQFDRIIQIIIREEGEKYIIEIANKCDYISYDEITKWFSLGKSSKGNYRGIGLYRVKQICSEQNCNLIVKNVDIMKENWIKFILEM